MPGSSVDNAGSVFLFLQEEVFPQGSKVLKHCSALAALKGGLHFWVARAEYWRSIDSGFQ